MGCLEDKTTKQKNDFFKSLFGFITTDPIFYNEQLCDLERNEIDQFNNWIKNVKKK